MGNNTQPRGTVLRVSDTGGSVKVEYRRYFKEGVFAKGYTRYFSKRQYDDAAGKAVGYAERKADGNGYEVEVGHGVGV